MNPPGASPAVHVRLAGPPDDPAIRRFLHEVTMPGSIALSIEPEHSFLDGAVVHGNDLQTIAAEWDDRIVGMGFLGFRPVYVDGTPAEIGYLGGLRIAPSVRAGPVLLKGFGLFRDLDRRFARVPFYLTTIMDDNPDARRVLTARHPNMPAYHPLADYRTLVLPVRRRRLAGAPGRFTVSTGDRLGRVRIAEFLSRGRDRRQFWPRYTEHDLDGGCGLLRGLRVCDFLVAHEDDRIVGALALWDQSAFRRHGVRAYSGLFRAVRPFLNLAARAAGYAAPFPAPGAPVRIGLVACPCIEGDDPAVFRALLAAGMAAATERGFALLAVGLAERDPLLPEARRFRHAELRSTLYAATWRDDFDPVPLLSRPPYLELGSL
jgi:hypothetical protein